MCVIIDTCTFHSVFNTGSADHHKYRAVYEWVRQKNGKMVIGGSKYENELRGQRVLGILAEYERMNRLVKVSGHSVDRIALELERKVSDKDFDDAHLIALAIVSKCRVICTNDMRALPFLKQKKLYPKKAKRPRIYRTARNANLCCNENIVGACVEKRR